MQPIPSIDLPVIEVFSTLQGEGPWIGARQAFVRLAECNLDCTYCDTPRAATETCEIEEIPGSGQFDSIPNPIELVALISHLKGWLDLAPTAYHSLSLTGGEPLLHGKVLRHWLPQLRELMPIYLETNGTLPELLEPLLPHLDYISIDIKLPSVAGTAPQWGQHRQFLRLAWMVPGYVKVVVSNETDLDELTEAALMVADEAENKELVLQPLTVDDRPAVSAQRLIDFQTHASRSYDKVRVIPQVHPMLGVL